MTLQETVQLALEKIDALEMQVGLLMQQVQYLNTIKTFSLGSGALAVKMDSDGLWVGAKTFLEATTLPLTATSIALNGDFYPKGGVSGTLTPGMGGGSITAVRGIITAIS